jgi:predicted membrane protein
MEDKEISNEEWRRMEKRQRRGKTMAGLLVVLAGSLFLAREMGVLIPEWIFTWQFVLIGIGLIIAVKHKMRHPGWILMLVGGAFLLNDFYPEFHLRAYIWPVLIILFGLFLIFKPRRKYHSMRYCRSRWKQRQMGYSVPEEPVAREDYIDSTAFMAGVKKNIVSKNFKGGDITNVFGGTELNLMQADFEGTVSLEVTQVFGGTTLVIPSNWQIRSELVTVLGGVEDKRPVQPVTGETSSKVLILTGTTFMGGMEIRSF